MNRRALGTFVAVLSLGALAACSSAPPESRDSSGADLTKVCVTNCQTPTKGTGSGNSGVYATAPLTQITTLPPNTTVDASGDFTDIYGCTPGFTGCDFVPQGDPPLVDPMYGNELPCTQVYGFDEVNADDTTENSNLFAYCAYGTADEQLAVNDWQQHYAGNPAAGSTGMTPGQAVVSTVANQLTLQAPAPGYAYLEWQNFWAGHVIQKCKANGSVCTVYPAY